MARSKLSDAFRSFVKYRDKAERAAGRLIVALAEQAVDDPGWKPMLSPCMITDPRNLIITSGVSAARQASAIHWIEKHFPYHATNELASPSTNPKYTHQPQPESKT